MNEKIKNNLAPIHYINDFFNKKWTIFKVKSGVYKDRMVCILTAFKDFSIVDLGDGGIGDEGMVLISNKDLGLSLDDYIEEPPEEPLEEYEILEEVDMEKENNKEKQSNPKDALGIKKVPFSCVPANVIGEIALGLMEGGRKYGRHNYRVVGVRTSVYYDAALRHLMSYWEGEDIDPDSGLSHISKALSCLTVLRDAMMNNMCEDDRPPKVIDQDWVRSLNIQAEEIIEKYPDSVPAYTEKNKK
jgi:hypothetical protein